MFRFFDTLNLWVAQLENQGSGAAKAAKDAGEGEGGGFGLGFFLPMMLAMIVIFMLMGRPGRKADAKQKELLESLKKNDRVVTAGGILGTVVNVRDDQKYVTLRIDESSNAKMQILKTSIIRVVDEESKKDAE